MDVRLPQRRAGMIPAAHGRLDGSSCDPSGGFGLDHADVGQALGEWQARELTLASRFRECRGLSTQQLEDLYQETALALLNLSFESAEHLRNALHVGLKHRALNLHRDERRRDEILWERRAHLQPNGAEKAEEESPEHVALLHEDRWVISEFMAELTEDERRVFGLIAEGMKYRRIAAVLPMEINRARNAARSCEQKRERFQLLYDTGRLCGFRSATIRALQSGECSSQDLAIRAFAHLEHCSPCRAEHKTNARRLRRTFQEQAAALLPVPALLGHLGWLSRAALRIRALQRRVIADGIPFGGGGARERGAALIGGTGAVKVLTAGVATVAVIAGGTIAAGSVQHKDKHARPHPSVTMTSTTGITPRPAVQSLADSLRALMIHQHPRTPDATQRLLFPGYAIPRAHHAGGSTPRASGKPGSFGWLGIPHRPARAAPGRIAGTKPPSTTARHHGGPTSP